MHDGVSRGLGWTALLALALLVLAPASVAAEAETDGTIAITARLDPPTLGPGQEGVLVVETNLDPHLHIYAQGDGQLTTWRTVAAAGVTYEVPAKEMTWAAYQADPGRMEWSKPKLYQDPNFPEIEPFPVWLPEQPLVLRIPVRVAKDAAPGTEIGVEVDYSACDEMLCYDRVRAQRAVVRLAGSGAAAPAPPVRIGEPTGDDAVVVRLEIDEAAGEAVVVFEPSFGYHLYMPGSMEGQAIEVEPQPDAGVTWGEVAFEDEGGKIHDPFEARIPFTREPDASTLRVRVSWQACNDQGSCFNPAEGILEARWGPAATPEPPMIDPEIASPAEPDPEPAPEPPTVTVDEGEKVLVEASDQVPFPRVYGDDIDAPRDDQWSVVDASLAPVETSEIAKRWQKSAPLTLLSIFVFGILLAFTPCVLPIIPLTISVIGGGSAGKVSRGRLTVMLTAYVLGLSMTYGLAGAVSGMVGKAIDLDAAFRIPWVVWSLVAFLLAMAAGMIGIFELQPPAWMERIRGGAAQKSGTLLGSFLLGIVAALLASPCTGPFVVSMLGFAATQANPMLGFLLLFTLGLGMGAVFFAAGSLNLLAKPGPWMVWVRYAFGVMLFGVALYLVASNGLLTGVGLLLVGYALALLAWWALAHHLMHKEGERPKVAYGRGAGLAVSLVLVALIVAELTHQDLDAGLLMRLTVGVGAVFLAAGAFMFLSTPGSGAVWVRYALGVVPFAAALYFGARGGFLTEVPLFAVGFALALVAWWRLSRRISQEGDEPQSVAYRRGAALAVTLALATGIVAQVTHDEGPVSAEGELVVSSDEGWIKVKDVEHLQAELARAQEEGRPAVVDVWATWCHNCKLYDVIIETDPHLKKQFGRFVRLKIDETDASRDDLRVAVGLPVSGQPRMAFFDEVGRIRVAAEIDRWFGKEDSIRELKRRVDFLLGAPQQ